MDRVSLTDDQTQAIQALASAGMPISKIAEVLMIPEDFITGNCPEWRVGRIERLRVEQLEAAILPPEQKTRRHGSARQRAFLAALEANGGSITDAAAAVGIDRHAHYHWMKTDPAYAEMFESSTERAADVLEDETVRRAKTGVLEPLFNRAGELIGHKLRFSDQLLLARLAADRPERWKPKVSAEVTGKDGGPIQIVITPEEAKL